MIDARLSEAGSDRERALLRLGAEEAPSARSVRAAARALGLVPGAAAVALLLGWVARALRWSTVGTYVVVPALGAGLIATAYMVVGKHAPSGATLVPAVAAAAPVAPAKAEAPAAVVVADARTVPAAAPVTMARRAHGVPARDVEAQVALVDHARALVAAGDPGGALRVVEEYGRRFPRGALAEEAALLRIEAIDARGDHAGAVSLARRFRAAYPKSVHLDKVQWLIGNGPK